MVAPEIQFEANPDHRKKRVGVKRAKAEKLVADLVERAGLVEHDSAFLYRVERLTVFGSFLGDKAKLGDIDIAVELTAKDANPQAHHEKCLAQGNREGPAFWLGRLYYPEEKVRRFLRARHSSFSFHDPSDLVALKTVPGFACRVIYECK